MTQISLDDLLRTAVEQANAGRESSLYYSFDTPAARIARFAGGWGKAWISRYEYSRSADCGK